MSGYNQGYGQGYPQQQGYAGYGACRPSSSPGGAPGWPAGDPAVMVPPPGVPAGAAPSGGYGAYGGYDASGYGRGAGMGWDRGAPGGMMGMQGDYRDARGPRPGYGGPAGSPMGAPMGGGGGFACVRLRGLPFGVTERDIVLFLVGGTPRPAGRQLQQQPAALRSSSGGVRGGRGACALCFLGAGSGSSSWLAW